MVRENHTQYSAISQSRDEYQTDVVCLLFMYTKLYYLKNDLEDNSAAFDQRWNVGIIVRYEQFNNVDYNILHNDIVLVIDVSPVPQFIMHIWYITI